MIVQVLPRLLGVVFIMFSSLLLAEQEPAPKHLPKGGEGSQNSAKFTVINYNIAETSHQIGLVRNETFSNLEESNVALIYFHQVAAYFGTKKTVVNGGEPEFSVVAGSQLAESLRLNYSAGYQ